MRGDQPSTTAAIVAAARAEIDRRPTLRDFSDPYAEALLPRAYTRGPAAFLLRRLSRPGAHLFALRTNAIDHGIRTAPVLEQLVILGAGLDARAWRMPELRDVPVFEVDHPSTQRYKRRRAETFDARAHHHYVAVDFEHDSLGDRLAQAGHRPERPTVWVWEGVTMYLHPAAVEGTLETVSSRSAPGSRLLMTYLPPSAVRTMLSLGVRVLGEPFRAAYHPEEVDALLRDHHFRVTLDESAIEWNERWANDGAILPPLVSDTERLVTADRADG